MATVVPLQGASGFVGGKDAGSGELLPRVFRVEGLAIGEDATQVLGIPLEDSEFEFGGRKYFCDTVGVSRVISDNACDVTCRYSTDRRFRFNVVPSNSEDPSYREYDFGYKKVSIKVPQFAKIVEQTSTGTKTRWNPTPFELDIEKSTFNTVVNLTNVANPLAIRNQIADQVGHLHNFQFPGISLERWVMQPPSIRSTKPGQLTIAYAWESDPGNGPIGLPLGYTSSTVIVAPTRPPFFVYNVIPSQVVDGPPTIVTQDLFLDLHPYNTPDGWIGLPGNPI